MMKLSMLAAGVGVLGAVGLSVVPSAPASVLKNETVIMIYAGPDSVITLIAHKDSAIEAGMLMRHKQGKTVRVHELVGRPCIGVATFPMKEWTRLTSNGRPPADVRPSETKWHQRWYPAVGDTPAAVFSTELGYGWVPLELPESDWPVMEHVKRATGPCAAQ